MLCSLEYCLHTNNLTDFVYIFGYEWMNITDITEILTVVHCHYHVTHIKIKLWYFNVNFVVIKEHCPKHRTSTTHNSEIIIFLGEITQETMQ